ncbi:MAG TPA: hypothetical protein VNQ80_09405 [Parapedobacter sp.]|uniref:lipopolysaccharide biosynthesis protein n=1 Tax=Parapedobacter sp. TaxID=1958893 RepID=UPI002D189C3C|nr:lipopolysaccharide biosynthesis protein [Parapedobacter sp.]HWK57543.1 hypothetical protein [Parapedobacter sp.]
MGIETKYATEDNEASTRDLILSIRNWLHYLVSKWLILIVVGVLGGIVGLGYALIYPKNYMATTTFVLEGGDGRSNLAQYAGMAAMVGIDLGTNAGGLFEGDNILELYKSRRMLAQTLLSPTFSDSTELLIERYITFNNIKKSWGKNPELLSIDFRQDPNELNATNRRQRDSILTEFTNVIKEDFLRVDKPDKKLSIIQVQVTSPDEVFSKAFNENLVRRVNDFYIQTKTKKSTDNIEILQHKVDSVRAAMEGAIYSAAKVSDATPNLNPTRQAQRVVPAQEAQFSAESNRVMLTQLLQNLELTKMNLLQEQPLIQLVDQPVYPLAVNRVGKIMGILVGGFLAVFLVVTFLIVKKWYHDVMTEDA